MLLLSVAAVAKGLRHQLSLHGNTDGVHCQKCQFKTKFKYNLLRHIESQHAKEDENDEHQNVSLVQTTINESSQIEVSSM